MTDWSNHEGDEEEEWHNIKAIYHLIGTIEAPRLKHVAAVLDDDEDYIYLADDISRTIMPACESTEPRHIDLRYRILSSRKIFDTDATSYLVKTIAME